MATVRKVHDGTALTTSLATAYTVGTVATGGGIIEQIIVVNDNTTTVRTVTVQLIKSGQAAAQSYLIAEKRVAPNDSQPLLPGPIYVDTGAFIQAKQDTGTDCTIRITALEVS